jgi:hypothetical protein
MGWLTPRPAALPPAKRPGTHCTIDWVGPRVGLDGCGKSRPHRDSSFFFFFGLSVPYLYFFVLTVLALPFVVYNTHNTNNHVAGRIRTRNPSKRSAADPSLRPLGHWDQLIRSPDRSACSESLHRLSYPGQPSTMSQENSVFDATSITKASHNSAN